MKDEWSETEFLFCCKLFGRLTEKIITRYVGHILFAVSTDVSDNIPHLECKALIYQFLSQMNLLH